MCFHADWDGSVSMIDLDFLDFLDFSVTILCVTIFFVKSL